jgi:plastocyanin
VKKLLILAAALVAAAVVALPAAAGTTTVKIGDNFFSPKTKTVSRGTTVKWVFKGKVAHNVTVTKGTVKFHSTTKSSGSYSHKMTRGGTYKIICTIHPGMEMTLKVR